MDTAALRTDTLGPSLKGTSDRSGSRGKSVRASDAMPNNIRCVTRTTIDLDDGILRALKVRRENEGRSLGVIASELVARALGEDEAPTTAFAWVSQPMGVTVDLEDRDALWAALDAPQ